MSKECSSDFQVIELSESSFVFHTPGFDLFGFCEEDNRVG